MVENVRPLEETDSELDGLLKWFCNDKISKVKRVNCKVPVIATTDKVGRNDPCTCGSGKKYKKCCGKN